ncbi:HipA domain-containing protein [Flavobacterium luteolum]|uniref:HipA domain-containing protein n=1 Tax=Flavobacterium luteolum TaxID=3003259 RepID=UPI00248EDFAF|nr:HipA domain-containing protein [Flavobacterium luteolum]
MKCLLCYKELPDDEIDFHPKCLQNTFGIKKMPEIEIDDKKLVSYAKEIIDTKAAVTGVQPKLSLWLEGRKNNIRFTIIDNKSNYIFKPQSDTHQSLPENEDLCMHLAQLFGIKTADHGLVRLPSGNLAYLTKRFDRNDEQKLACEDLCQLTETLTEGKYKGSHEKTGKTIRQYSSQAGLDSLRYFEIIVFSFVTGNADMHLKNFSMLEQEDGLFTISPAYDLVSTYLVIPNENEQLSLAVNGKRNKLRKSDFAILGKSLGLTEKQIENTYKIFSKRINKAVWWIENSFLPEEQKEKLINLISTRIEMLNS